MDQEAQESVHHEQYLTFRSAGEDYAIGILQVKEIIPYDGSTKVPMAPEVVSGLINLRGKAVPVIDLAIKFGAQKTTSTNRTCVVIVDLVLGNEEIVMGILTDSVRNVIDIPAEEIDDAPNFGTGIASRYLKGLAKINDAFIPIINVETVMAPEDILASVLPQAQEEEEDKEEVPTEEEAYPSEI